MLALILCQCGRTEENRQQCDYACNVERSQDITPPRYFRLAKCRAIGLLQSIQLLLIAAFVRSAGVIEAKGSVRFNTPMLKAAADTKSTGRISMNVARYADYIGDLRALFSELDRRPERFQTFDVRLELVAAGSLVIYETKRRKGQTDSLYYGRSAATGQNQQISQAAAFTAIDRFFALGQFVALSDQAVAGKASQGRSVSAQYPHCAVNFSYRKKGQAVARSTLMVFVGFNDETDALEFLSTADEHWAFVRERPHYTEKSHEWK